MTFFEIFFSVAHLLIQTKLFCFIKYSYLQPFREIMGGQTKRHFSTKNDATGQKMTFFGFFFCCTSSRRDETFLLLPKFHIFSRSEKSWGDQKKRYIDDDDERTNERTNERRRRRRTTWTIIIPRQDSQNPRANNMCISSFCT